MSVLALIAYGSDGERIRIIEGTSATARMGANAELLVNATFPAGQLATTFAPGHN